MKTEFKSRVYTDRPAYADFDAPANLRPSKRLAWQGFMVYKIEVREDMQNA